MLRYCSPAPARAIRSPIRASPFSALSSLCRAGTPTKGGCAAASSPATPNPSLYAGFGDFGFWRLNAVSAHLNGGFARAADLKAADVLTDLTGAESLIEAEESAVSHMNNDHAEAVRLYATRLLGGEDGRWRLTGLDPDGLDLVLGDTALRLPFPERVNDPQALRKMVVELAAKARTVP